MTEEERDEWLSEVYNHLDDGGEVEVYGLTERGEWKKGIWQNGDWIAGKIYNPITEKFEVYTITEEPMNKEQTAKSYFSNQERRRKAEWLSDMFSHIANGGEVEMFSITTGNALNIDPDYELNMRCESRFWRKVTSRVTREISYQGAETTKPKLGAEYYIPYLHTECMINTYIWGDGSFDIQQLERHMVHLNKDNAIAHAKALLGMDEQEQNV